MNKVVKVLLQTIGFVLLVALGVTVVFLWIKWGLLIVEWLKI